jgi:D-glycero-alpha-D-manno-heptose-7-phosphate kinase
MIIVRVPHRVSLVGGGTDFPAWYEDNGGAVIAFAVQQYCYVSLRVLPSFATNYRHRLVYSKIELVNETHEIDHPAIRAVLEDQGVEDGVEIHHAADVPARAGLGSSSAFTVGLLHALAASRGRMISKDDLAREAIRVEQKVMRESVGSQDQCTAAHGGFNRIDFDDQGPHVRPLVLPRGRVENVLRHLLLVFTGVQRVAAEVETRKIADVARHALDYDHLREMVTAVERTLTAPSFDPRELGLLLSESWQVKRSLTGGVSSEKLDDIFAHALDLGALGGKLLGAGGGGCFLLVVAPEQRATVKYGLGLIEIPLAVDHDGSRIVVYAPNGLGH